MEVPCFVSVKEQFYEACRDGQMDAIDSLLGIVDVNDLVNGKLPLHKVCKKTKPWDYNTLDVVTKLIAHGADVDLEDKYGWNALDFVLHTVPFQPRVAQLLLNCSKQGVNRLDSKHFSYLWVAGSLEAVKFLVENGIDVNHVTRNQTYLEDSIGKRYDYLRSVGAKLCSEL